MKKDDLDKLTLNIQTKLGEENSSLIADDLALLMTENSKTNEEISNKNEEIKKLKADKEMLISTNGKLLQQVSMGIEEKEEIKENSLPKSVNFNNFLDEKGNFKIN